MHGAVRAPTWFQAEALELLRRRGRVTPEELRAMDADQVRGLLERHGFQDAQGHFYGPSGQPMRMPHPEDPQAPGPTAFPDALWCAEQMGWDWRKNPWLSDRVRARLELWELRQDLQQRCADALGVGPGADPLHHGDWSRVEGWFRRAPSELWDGEVGHLARTAGAWMREKAFPQRSVPMIGDMTMSYARLLELMALRRVKRITLFNGGADALVEVPCPGLANEYLHERTVGALEPGTPETTRDGAELQWVRAQPGGENALGAAVEGGFKLSSQKVGGERWKVNPVRQLVESPEFTMEKEKFYCPLPGDLWEDGGFMELYKQNLFRRDPATGLPTEDSVLQQNQCFCELVVQHPQPLYAMAGRMAKYSPPLIALFLVDALVVGAIKWRTRQKEKQRKAKDKKRKSPALAFNLKGADGEEGKKIGVTLDDVAGLEGVKQRVREVMGVLVKENVSFQDLGVRPPRGVLLYGPPGTGKTLIAKGVAGEFDVPFFACSGSEFVEMYPGVAAQRLRDLFRQARENAPSVIFIDEIDAIAKRRTEGGELSEQDLGLFQLLVEMDGFGTYDDRVLVVGATNLKESLDPAMLRPGRLERHFYIDKPNRENRLAVLKVHAKKKLMVPHAGHPRLDDGDALLTWLAARTGGYNGAALENILNEATIVAVRRELAGVDEGVLRTLLEERGSGAPQGTAPGSASKRRLAGFHAARACVKCLAPKGGNAVKLVSLRQRRGRATGVVSGRQDPAHAGMMSWFAKPRCWRGERVLGDWELLRALLVPLLVGRVWEEEEGEGVSFLSSFETAKAAELARALVADSGLDPEWRAPYAADVAVLGMQPFRPSQNPALRARAAEVLQEARALAGALLADYAPAIATVAARLEADEDVSGEDLRAVLLEHEEGWGLGRAEQQGKGAEAGEVLEPPTPLEEGVTETEAEAETEAEGAGGAPGGGSGERGGGGLSEWALAVRPFFYCREAGEAGRLDQGAPPGDGVLEEWAAAGQPERWPCGDARSEDAGELARRTAMLRFALDPEAPLPPAPPLPPATAEDGSPREPGPVFGDEEMWVEAFKVNRLREVEAQEHELFLPQGAGEGAAGGGGKPGEQPSQESAASS